MYRISDKTRDRHTLDGSAENPNSGEFGYVKCFTAVPANPPASKRTLLAVFA
tara:strand:- start:15171 stop:15326 length:156 start_codon:yes stop_codon:yes gene_type:complete